jgi:SAM-dependent methyltransferase
VPTVNDLYYSALGALYRGDTFFCPCCDRSYRAFLPFGINPRTNAQCPGCGSLERHRLIMLFLRDRTPLFTAPHSLLDIAPERSIQRVLLRALTVSYTSGDLDSPLADIRLDITRMPFEAATFDVVLCMHVLEHVPDDRQAMKEMYRVLKPGGWAIIQAPVSQHRETTFEDPSVSSPQERVRLFGQEDHVRDYGRDYPDRLRSAGFEVDVVPFLDELPDEIVERCSLRTGSDRNIYLCRT